MSRGDLPRVAILGAGPIGLEAALQAALLGLPFVVYERGRIGEYLRQWGHVRLFSPFGMNTTLLGKAQLRKDRAKIDLPADADLLTGREYVENYLEPLAQSPLLREHIRMGTTVVQVGRRGYLKEENPGERKRGEHPFLLALRTDARESMEEADLVLDCTGVYGQPRALGDGGIPTIGESAARSFIAWGLEDILGERGGFYADKTTMVIGGGYSAATSVCLLAKLAEKHSSTWVIWLSRGGGTQPIKRFVDDALKERDQLAVRANTMATRGDGNVEFHPQTTVTAIECAGIDKGFKVMALSSGKPKTWEVDRVIANVGSMPDRSLYSQLQVQECYSTMAPQGLASILLKHQRGDPLGLPFSAVDALRHPEPNFFILGAKSYGLLSSFFIRAGMEQVRQIFTFVAGNEELLSRFPGLRQLRKSSKSERIP